MNTVECDLDGESQRPPKFDCFIAHAFDLLTQEKVEERPWFDGSVDMLRRWPVPP